MLSKLAGPAHTPGRDFSHLWFVKTLFHINPLLLFLSVPGILATVFSRKTADLVLLTYLLLYLAAYSIIDLGDTYPWYAVPAAYMMVLVISINWNYWLQFPIQWFLNRDRMPEKIPATFHKKHLPLTLLIIAIALPLLYGNNRFFNRNGPLASYEKGNLARATAGVWLRKMAAPGEIFETSWGLPAFEYRGPVFDPAGLCSTPGKRKVPDYIMFELQPHMLFSKKIHNNYFLLATFRIPGANYQYAIYSLKNARAYRQISKISVNPTMTLQNPRIDSSDAYLVLPSDFSILNTRQQKLLEKTKLPHFPAKFFVRY